MISPDQPLVLIGAGNMGGAMLNGWLDQGVDPASIMVVDPSPPDAMVKRLAELGVRHEVQAPEGVTAGILLLAVKPQIAEKALPPAAKLVGPDTVSVSVAAGKTMEFLEGILGGAVIRAMPNTPAMVGRGITACFPNDKVTAEARTAVQDLLAVCGLVEWVDSEDQIDAVTAVSGSGPAYAFYLVECMAEAGRKCGLPADLAMRLARATVSGAGEMMHQAAEEAGTLRKNVTSPNGTTAAALSVLMAEDGLQPLMDKAVTAAYERSKELAK